MSFKEIKWSPYLLIFIIACITFWPLTFGVFSLKNDDWIYFLPWRYHISESIQHGYLPLWSPYLYTGIPLHSDMQSGAWNPVVLFISLFTTYNMQVMQWELLLYIFIAGAGMHKLISESGYSDKTSITGAVAYMCCGFVLDSGSFIPWITCAAYLPFAFIYFYRLLNYPTFAISVKFSVTLFLLLTAGYPGYLIYLIYVLTAAFIYWAILNRREKKVIFTTLRYSIVSIALFLLLAVPVLLSFTEFLPYYKRGAGASLEQALSDSFNPFCSISYLLPSAVAKSHVWFSNDIAMRNATVGIFVLAFFIISLTGRLTKTQKFILGSTVFSFVFSLGSATPLREWCYHLLPFMNSFRHPAIIRVFTSIGIILMAAQTIEFYFTGHGYGVTKRKLQITLSALGMVILAFVLYYLWHGTPFKNLAPSSAGFKEQLDHLDFSSVVIIQGIIQILFITGFLILLNKKRILLLLMAGNVIVFAFMAMPFTLISRVKTSDTDHYLHSFPKGFPAPDLLYPAETFNQSNHVDGMQDGLNKFYEKKITIQDNIVTPTLNSSYFTYLADTLLRKSLGNVSFAFISSAAGLRDNQAVLTIDGFSPNHFLFNATTATNEYLVLLQQYNPDWRATVNGVPAGIEKSFTAFMQIPVPAGKSVISFNYQPRNILFVSMYASGILLISLIIYLILHSIGFRAALFQKTKEPRP